MTRRLNRDEPFGTICGGGSTHAAFEQDGLLFDVNGVEIADGSVPKTKAKAPAKAKQVDPVANQQSAEEQVSAFLGEEQGGMAS